jgi:PAS domain S-box-containing protein
MNLRTKITLFLGCLSILPLMAAMGISLWSSTRQVRHLTIESATANVHAGAEKLSGYFGRRLAEIKAYANSPVVRTMDWKKIGPYFKAELGRHGGVYEKLALVTPGSHYYITSGGNPARGGMVTFDDRDPKSRLKTAAKRKYWQYLVRDNGRAEPRIFISDPIISYTTGVRQIVVGATILSADRRRVMGLAAGSIEWREIKRLVTAVRRAILSSFGRSARMVLVSPSGVYIYHWNPAMIVQIKRDRRGRPVINEVGERMSSREQITEAKSGELARAGRAMIKGQEGFVFYTDPATGRAMVFIYAPIKSAGYSLGLAVPRDQIMTPVSETALILGLVLAAVSLIALVAAFVMAGKITRPITTLSQAARDLAAGRLKGELPAEGGDELAQLTRTFNQMASSLEKRHQALLHSESEYRDFVNDLPVGLYRSTPGPEGRFIFANPAMVRIFGYDSDEEFLQIPASSLYHDPKERRAFSDKIMSSGRVESEELHLRGKDGQEIWASITARTVRDESGEVAYFEGVTVDITPGKQAEEDLRRTRDLFEAVFQHHPNPLLLVRRDDGLVRIVNQAFEQVWGYHQDQIAGRFARVLYHDPASRDEMLARLAEKGFVRDFESLGLKADGNTAPVLISVEPVEIVGEPHLIVTAQDITERKQQEEERDRLERQLHQAQKMEAIGRLAGGMAHDFNNLLAVIMGYSQLALRRLEPGRPFRKELEAIDQASQRAASLIHQLLAFSRRQILQPKVLCPNRLVAGTERMLGRLIGEDIELITVLSPDVGRIKADPGQIEQLIVNLAVNARDAIEGIGKLTIETAPVYLDEAYCRDHPDASPGPHVMLALSDNGKGMDEETKAKIFDPFFTTKDADKGTGLGLATVYGIVKQSGGNIYVYSEPGRGTTFKIYLPVVEAEETAPPLDRDDDSFPRGTETILVVEDEEGIRKFILDALEYGGYTALEASDGVEALKVFQGHPDTIQLVITDVVMPRMSGRDLAGRLAEMHPETKVLFMSGYTDNAIVHHGMLDDGIDFIAKPFTPAALAQKIREILDDKN